MRNKNTKMYGLWTKKNLTLPKPNSKFNLKQTQNWENWISAKKTKNIVHDPVVCYIFTRKHSTKIDSHSSFDTAKSIKSLYFVILWFCWEFVCEYYFQLLPFQWSFCFNSIFFYFGVDQQAWKNLNTENAKA